MRYIALIVTIFIIKSGHSQESDSILKSFTRSIERSISRGHDHKICQNFEDAIFSIAITFTSDSRVEDVIFSNSPNCFIKSKENIEKHLRSNINKIKLEKSGLDNKFILAIIYVLPNEKGISSHQHIPKNWEHLFDGIDFNKLEGKNLKYSIPIGIYLLNRIEN